MEDSYVEDPNSWLANWAFHRVPAGSRIAELAFEADGSLRDRYTDWRLGARCVFCGEGITLFTMHDQLHNYGIRQGTLPRVDGLLSYSQQMLKAEGNN